MNLFKKEEKTTAKTSSALKYGGYASIMTAIVIVAVIVINLVVSSLGIKVDLTKNKLYTLSEDTITLIKNLEDDVTITSVYAEGTEISVITELLDKYASYSKHVTVKNVDPYTNPAFAAQYAAKGDVVAIGSIVVEANGGYKIIPQEEMADIYVNQETGEQYMQGIKVENVLTGAIRNLISGESKIIYELTGHGEIAVGEGLAKELSYSGFEVKTLDLVTKGSVPEDCETLIVNGAISDFSSAELKAINAYLDNGGSALITLGATVEETANIDSLLENYGIENSKTMLIEGSPENVYNQNPFYIVPTLNKEDTITKAMVSGGTNIFMPFANEVKLSDAKRSTVEITTLAETSQYAYGKDLTTMTGYEQQEGDAVGPFNVAVSLEDSDGGIKLVVCGSQTILDDGINQIINGGNFGFVMNCVDYLTGSEISAHSKSIGAEDYLQLTQSKAIGIMFVCVILLPLIILISGVVVTLRRRNR